MTEQFCSLTWPDRTILTQDSDPASQIARRDDSARDPDRALPGDDFDMSRSSGASSVSVSSRCACIANAEVRNNLLKPFSTAPTEGSQSHLRTLGGEGYGIPSTASKVQTTAFHMRDCGPRAVSHLQPPAQNLPNPLLVLTDLQRILCRQKILVAPTLTSEVVLHLVCRNRSRSSPAPPTHTPCARSQVHQRHAQLPAP
eukprot:443936-Rhodomonas_salina.2